MKEQPMCPKKGPYSVMVNAAEIKFWCSCGRSQSQPYCDGSHKGTDFLPMKIKLDEGGYLRLCGCKMSKNPPYCDGSHHDL